MIPGQILSRCDINSECRITDSECRNTKCRCKPGLSHDPGSNTCVTGKRTNKIGFFEGHSSDNIFLSHIQLDTLVQGLSINMVQRPKCISFFTDGKDSTPCLVSARLFNACLSMFLRVVCCILSTLLGCVGNMCRLLYLIVALPWLLH